jgi:hypothetical protein
MTPRKHWSEYPAGTRAFASGGGYKEVRHD